MITITLPLWFTIFLTVIIVLSLFNDMLKAYSWYLSRKLKELKGEKT